MRAQRHAFVQIALPLFAASFPSYPLTFTPAGRATGPTGLADVLEAVGPDGFTWKVFFDASTHLPASMTWMGKPIVVTSRTSSTMVTMSSRGEVMSRPGADPGPILPADPAAGLPDVQWQLTFEDYKLEDGLKWPHRLTKSYPGLKYEVARMGRFKINPKINPNLFKPTK